jgi:hypothetical protein
MATYMVATKASSFLNIGTLLVVVESRCAFLRIRKSRF